MNNIDMAPKEKEQKDKQRSTKHTHKTNDRIAEEIPHLIFIPSVTIASL
jgi:hypothetical protein